MSVTETIHKDLADQFELLIEKQRLAHAYLFIGPRDVGKHETALFIASKICDDIDIHIVESEEEKTSITIEQIRMMLDQVKLRAFSSDKKVFIIKNAEELTLEAGNALLKTLEEPSKNSILILTTSKPQWILETIQSRCQNVYFATPKRAEIKLKLMDELHEDLKSAHFLGYFSEGCFGTAQKLKKNNLFKRKNQMLDAFLYTPDAEAFIKQYLKGSESMREFLEILLSWIRDAMLIQSGSQFDDVIHLDRADDLKEFQSKFSFDELKSLYSDIIHAQKMLMDNFNMKLPLLIIKEKLSWAK